MGVFERLMRIRDDAGAGFLLLLDPDSTSDKVLTEVAANAEKCGVDAILAGSSFVTSAVFNQRMAAIKAATRLPVIIFPGGSGQVSKHADAILFTSLISGRNPNYLIEEQVRGAPLVQSYGLEAIPTGYMLIESGNMTSVQYISGTQPIPRDKIDIAMAHALAARYMGMKMIYLEAGSGAKLPVPEDMISQVADYCRLPLIVGGGIRRPEEAAARVRAGASFIVVGTQLEQNVDFDYMTEMVEAVHCGVRSPV